MQERNYLPRQIKKKIYSCLLLFVLIVFSSSGYANIDNEKTIHVEADNLQFNNETKIGTYQGHIKVTQGSRILTADHAISYSNQAGELTKIIASGHPAVYHAFVFHKQPKLIATGNTIYYYPLKDYLEAVGDAQIIQGQNHFQGPQINYDFKKRTVVSPLSKEGHTKISLVPIRTLHS